jgi:hypothetical protein
MSAWKNAMLKARRESAKPPEGAQTMEQIAEDMGITREYARQEVIRLIKLGRAEQIPGHLVTAAGAVVKTSYFRLITEPRGLKKGSKR